MLDDPLLSVLHSTYVVVVIDFTPPGPLPIRPTRLAVTDNFAGHGAMA